ncbi:hypothetical protein TNIN_159771 [Trichonephila inaurata madagascariensis]|uniref:Uncharacterized protein n=1 Tax=Trichonephila inaurata madagascariensis TaxID=2747483 RepID=A0A8X7BUZ5_9ARAC|nr:hypothetical protein TNIN_159771 [Trichonephila inaurata madagascariensis]
MGASHWGEPLKRKVVQFRPIGLEAGPKLPLHCDGDHPQNDLGWRARACSREALPFVTSPEFLGLDGRGPSAFFFTRILGFLVAPGFFTNRGRLLKVQFLPSPQTHSVFLSTHGAGWGISSSSSRSECTERPAAVGGPQLVPGQGRVYRATHARH